MNRGAWQELIDELRDNPYQSGVINAQTPVHKIEFDAGLTDEEVLKCELRFDFRFPPDLRQFLQTALPRPECAQRVSPVLGPVATATATRWKPSPNRCFISFAGTGLRSRRSLSSTTRSICTDISMRRCLLSTFMNELATRYGAI